MEGAEEPARKRSAFGDSANGDAAGGAFAGGNGKVDRQQQLESFMAETGMSLGEVEGLVAERKANAAAVLFGPNSPAPALTGGLFGAGFGTPLKNNTA